MKKGLEREEIARRAAREIKDGMYVNIGIGIPNLIPDYCKNKDVIFHSENGLLGMGPLAPPGEIDPDIVNAGKQPVKIVSGGSIFSQSDSFALIRGKHLDMTILGAFQVSQKGDIANWHVPDIGRVPGVGGAMDLVVGVKRVIVTMTVINVFGRPCDIGKTKIVKECTFPLTGKACVDLIVTDMGVFKVVPEGLLLAEIGPGYSVDEVQAKIEPKMIIPRDLGEVSFAEN